MNDTLIKLEGWPRSSWPMRWRRAFYGTSTWKSSAATMSPFRALRDSVTSAVPWCGRPG